MILDYAMAKWLHVLSSTLMFGTGIGTAYYMFFASRTADARVAAVVMTHGVRADWLFTATTMVFQPLSGWYLARLAGWPLHAPWLAWSIGLFVLTGLCWLPVVWLQLRMRDLAREAASDQRALPDRYWLLLKVWVALGMPALVAMLVIFYLMVNKPMMAGAG
jgi:uncharacterized membrane protein